MSDRWDGMTEDEIAAAARQQWTDGLAEARARGDVPPRVSRVKQADYPHLQRVGWTFQLRRGAAIGWRETLDGALRLGTVEGRRLTETDDLVVVVRLDDQVWGVQRADGLPWPPEPTAWSVPLEHLDLEVSAWALAPQVVDDPDAVVALSGDPSRAWVRSGRLDEAPVAADGELT